MPVTPPSSRPVRPLGPGEGDAMVAFVAGQQADPERRVSYVGNEAGGIAAELDGLSPPWRTTARVLTSPDGVSGVVVAEWDEGLGRAWVLGPWVAGDGEAWAAGAATLLDAALAQVPAGVTRCEMSGEVANARLATLAAARGWGASGANHVLVADAAVVAGWPAPPSDAGAGDEAAAGAVRRATGADVAGIAVLHDAEFPDTYATAAQLVAGATAGERLVLVVEDGVGGVAGYAAGRVHEDGEGFVDFVGVAPAARGLGVGRRLVVAITRELLAGAPLGRVALTVQDHRAPARALYAALGFRPDGSLVAYRSWVD